MHLYRSHNCNELRAGNDGELVKLSGWVHRVRDHGGVLFIDLRDHFGLTQVLADPDSPVFKDVENVRAEWCISIEGTVRKRDSSLINEKLPTGEIEVFIAKINILGASEELPLPVFGDLPYPEETRLKYRFLDLRRDGIHQNIILRSKIIEFIRKEMWENGFNEFQTPIISSSSPEGARDFLIPSRLHPGKFYALPQAPQIYKQLIMVGGFDKYFQIAPCFRDEDPRSDRSPIKMMDVSEFFVSSGFKIFADILMKDGTQIKAIPAKGGGSRKFCDRMNKFAQEQGLPGMGYIFWRSDDSGNLEAAGPIAKNLGEEKTEKLRNFLGLDKGDAAFFLGGVPAHFNDIASKARDIVGIELDITNSNSYEFCWITDFPMYERDTETGKIEFSHNPFSMPKTDLLSEDIDPLSVLGMQYDLSCNGYEILSGAIRNHKLENLFKAFEIAGYTKEEVESQFSGLVNALKYGAPPHGGCAAGIDRIVMLLAKEDNIREVIMFPMNQKAEDPMLGSPRNPTVEQLDELKLKIIDHDL